MDSDDCLTMDLVHLVHAPDLKHKLTSRSKGLAISISAKGMLIITFSLGRIATNYHHNLSTEWHSVRISGVNRGQVQAECNAWSEECI